MKALLRACLLNLCASGKKPMHEFSEYENLFICRHCTDKEAMIINRLAMSQPLLRDFPESVEPVPRTPLGCPYMVGRPAAYTVNYTGLNGQLHALLAAPSGDEKEAIVYCSGYGMYAVRFTPQENGPHLIHLSVNGVPIPGSPFRIVVGYQEQDASLVHATGKGLVHGLAGQRSTFFVNTAYAVTGPLSVTVDGPTKVQLNCSERAYGYEYEVSYLTLVPGLYTININYGLEKKHIPGSPFKAYVSGDTFDGAHNPDTPRLTMHENLQPKPGLSDSERVICMGQGLETAFLQMANAFLVNARDAGIDVLYVGILGPILPCEEVSVKYQGNGLFSVNYIVKDRGEHQIMVKWGDRHVPGSPFFVMAKELIK
ncbi:hypothetical protein Ciccas_006979 [Cichlidogyrus casuarinus]|uniref:Uncharacterized protein n=1 Tax=Cichlidogyrus casuarinus TaxID=1844966 RepID=A0ABD2Q466_9PLAT